MNSIGMRGVTKCDSCHNSFEWVEFIMPRTRVSGNELATVVELPEDPKAHSVKLLDNGNYYVQVNCPRCGHDNHFEHILESERDK